MTLIKIFLGSLLLSAIILLAGNFYLRSNRTLGVSRSADLIHNVEFFERDSFYSALGQVKGSQPFASPVLGGIIPHHLLVSNTIADFFSRLSYQKPKTIIIIGPNHLEKGDFPVMTSLAGWQTHFGVAQPNSEFIRRLVGQDLARVDEKILPTEHSVVGIIPFVKFFLPEARVVPLLLSNRMGEGEAGRLAETLASIVNEETIIVAAVDFSHYLKNKVAQEKDKVTLSLMNSNSYRELLGLNNDYLDGPSSIVTLLITMKSLGAGNQNFLAHTNSGELLRDDNIPTTSYFSIVYSKENNPATDQISTASLPGFSIEDVFSTDHSWTATLSAQRTRVLLATGDVMPGRSVNAIAAKYKNPNWPYEKTADITNQADVTFINLESPLISNCPFTNEGMKFCGRAENVSGLVFAGVDVANLANNHTTNYGLVGLTETANLLLRQNILPSGLSGPVYRNVKGKVFAFLGYNDVGGIAKETRIIADIGEARQKAELIIVAFHWGSEYTTKISDRQKYLGHLAIDAGADLIIGNHPHWVQPIENYRGKAIVYSHGNFVFDQMWSQKTREGVVGRYTFYDNTLIGVEFLPMVISNYGQPAFTADDQEHAIMSEMQRESYQLLPLNTLSDL